MPDTRDARSKRWCCTFKAAYISADDLQGLAETHCDHWVFQREIASSGHEHFQAFFILKARWRLKQLCDTFGTKHHYEKTRGTVHDAWVYCEKADTRDDAEPPRSSGECPSEKQPGRNSEFITAMKEDLDDDELTVDFPDVLLRHPAALELARSYREITGRGNMPDPLEGVELKWWEVYLEEKFQETPHERTIFWVVDTKGGQGKSTWLKSMRKRFPKEVCTLPRGKADGCALMLKETASIIILDLPRSIADDDKSCVNYGLIESVKNGLVPSFKYYSRMKSFPIPHVVVLSNQPPDEGKFSVDRLVVLDLDDERVRTGDDIHFRLPSDRRYADAIEAVLAAQDGKKRKVYQDHKAKLKISYRA